MALQVTDANFEELVIKSDKPVLLDFWATWCGPCRAISPIVDELYTEYEGRAVVAKCNVDESTDLPTKFGVRNIPTILFFKNGELVDKIVGATKKAALAEKLDSLL